MIALIDEVRKDGDSIGGVCELVAVGVRPGLGEPVFDKLKADLAKALLSLPAVMAFEYGAGFAVATARGSANNDAFVRHPRRQGRHRNQPPRRHARRHQQRRAGRLPRRLKPTSSLPRPQRTVTRTGEPTEIVTAAGTTRACCRASCRWARRMVALVLADHWLRRRAQCGTFPE